MFVSGLGTASQKHLPKTPVTSWPPGANGVTSYDQVTLIRRTNPVLVLLTPVFRGSSGAVVLEGMCKPQYFVHGGRVAGSQK